MTATASVIVVSRNRPDFLTRCLTGIEQLSHPAFEVIVVADPAGLSALRDAGFGQRVVIAEFDTPNISAARNVGLGLAAGDLVAFIDDDAVPEPTWLDHLTAPFSDPTVMAAGGYVIGRNGITLQHLGRRVDRTGAHAPLPLAGTAPQVFAGSPGQGIKTEGTNCAFRAEVLRRIGGFDPSYRFYLDETDVNLRLAALGHRTAIVPLAQVHHGVAPSVYRRADRMPRNLTEIGASQTVFLRRHAADIAHDPVLDEMRRDQRARLLRHMGAGTCEPRDVARLLKTLEAGFAEGRARSLPVLSPLPHPTRAFTAFVPRTRFTETRTLSGRTWSAAARRRAAMESVRNGARTTLYLFGFTTLRHHVRFRDEGFWEQSGGLFGKSKRSDPNFRPINFTNRLQRERDRTADVRIVA